MAPFQRNVIFLLQNYGNPLMDDQSALPEHYPASPAAARVALHQLIQRLTDAEVTALWRLVCS